MFSTEVSLDASSRRRLLEIAGASISHGLQHGSVLALDPQTYPELLRAQRASFVTLHRQGELRGCIGSLEANRPLVVDVAENAFAAAYRDPRFASLRAHEFPELDIRISVLSPPVPLEFRDQADLLSLLRPGVDGLIFSCDGHRGTFLPSVWSSLPQPEQFLAQLKHKAGLPVDFWSPDVQIKRYTTETF